MTTSVCIHKSGDSDGAIVNITNALFDETFDPRKEARDIFGALFKNLPAITLAWLRNECIEHAGIIRPV